MVQLVPYDSSSDEDVDLQKKQKRSRTIELLGPLGQRWLPNNQDGDSDEEFVYDPIKKRMTKRPRIQISCEEEEVGGGSGDGLKLKQPTRSVSPDTVLGQTRFNVEEKEVVDGSNGLECGASGARINVDEEDPGRSGAASHKERIVLHIEYPQFPSGFIFSPTDKQLVKFLSLKIRDPLGFHFKYIHEVEIYNYHPEDLCKGSERLFFTLLETHGRDARIARTVNGIGHWHMNGTTSKVGNGAVRRGLHFVLGKASDKNNTKWQMKEYLYVDPTQASVWVLSRIYHKSFTNAIKDDDADLVIDQSHLMVN